MLFETAQALAESATLEEAAPRMLKAVCEALGWQCGAVWQVNRARNTLRCVGTWGMPGLPLEEFTAATAARTFAIGVGLPGRVWARREPVWVRDVTRDSNFPRAKVAERGGLHSAFALPILQGRRVGGVLEFFSRDMFEPTPELLTMMTTVCSQIGLYVERKWAGEDLDRFFKLSLDLFCIATFDGYFVRVNPAWQTVLGFSDEEMRASPFMDFVHPDDRDATLRAMSALTTGERVIDFENRYRAKDGSYKWLQWKSAPFIHQGLVYAVARDVTDRRAAEEALQQNAERLSQLVRELDVARQRAEQATRGQGRIPRQHEPRDPHADERHHRHDRSDAADAADAAAARVHQDGAGIRRSADDDHRRHPGRLEDRGAPADARSRAVPLPRHGRRQRQAARAARRPEGPGSVLPDCARCAGRASSATPGGFDRSSSISSATPSSSPTKAKSPSTCRSPSAAPTTCRLRFTVRDTGIGIPQDKQWEIFGAFVQADASTTRRYGGTGLGLTISTQLVEMMDGRMWLDSEPGKGSQFHFVARFGIARDAVEPLRRPRATCETCGSSSSTTTRPIDCILSEILASWQMRASAVDTAAAALESLQQAADEGNPFHLLLTDALMPDVDGFSLAQQVARDDRLEHAEGDPPDVGRGARREGARQPTAFAANAGKAGQAVRSARCHRDRLRPPPPARRQRGKADTRAAAQARAPVTRAGGRRQPHQPDARRGAAQAERAPRVDRRQRTPGRRSRRSDPSTSS